MKKAFPLLFALFCSPVFAQVPGAPGGGIAFPAFPEELRRYLELTNDQVDKILRLNAGYQAMIIQKSQRAALVQREIAEETAKDVLDPLALGLRYVELEAIRRELADGQKTLHDSLVAVLTAAQRAKLQTLLDAIALQPLIGQAQCENLILITPALPPGVMPALGSTGAIGGSTAPGVASFFCGSPITVVPLGATKQ